MIKPRKSLTAFALCSTFLLLTTVARGDFATASVSTGAKHTMPEMEHPPTEADQAMPEADHGMPEMNHGSMSLGPKDENFDLRFIDAMIFHHQGALRMAEEALEKSDRVTINRIAEQITIDQRRELRRMQQWRRDWYPNADMQPVMYGGEMGNTVPMSAEMREAMMMNVDMGTADAEFDLRFINAMIEHHEGAIVMAGEALAQSDRPNIRRLARTILQFQQREIAQMRTWRSQWYDQ